MQRPKRKAASRMTFEEAEEPTLPAKKKTKTELEDATHVNGKTNGASSRRAKVYDEQIDGFTFSRATRSRRVQPKEVTATELAAPTESAPSRSTRKPKASPPPAASDSAPSRRKSKRLSADKEQEPPQDEKVSRSKKSTKEEKLQPVQRIRDESPQPPVESLHVEKKRDVTTITLPFADTPVIKRNKEMRAAGRVSSHRRSSAGIRGRRASSLIESGTSNAVPHNDVQIEDFYKLIENDLMEPKRMRQLLVWCATRALLQKPRPTAATSTIETIAIESARQIQDELIKDFASKTEFSDWWSRTEGPISTAPKKPNPRNVRNAVKLKELEDEVQKLEAQEAAWQSLLSDPLPFSKQPSQSISSTATSTDSSTTIDASLLSASQQSLLQALGTHSPDLSSLSKRLDALTSTLEPTIDALADGVHTLAQYSSAAALTASRVTAVWAGRLQRRGELGRRQVQAAGTVVAAEGAPVEVELRPRGLGTRDLLRALAGNLNQGAN